MTSAGRSPDSASYQVLPAPVPRAAHGPQKPLSQLPSVPHSAASVHARGAQ